MTVMDIVIIVKCHVIRMRRSRRRSRRRIKKKRTKKGK